MEEKKCGTVKKSRSCDSPEREQGSREKKYKFSKTERTRFVSRKSRPGFSDEIFNETSYYFRNGLRCVRPYYFTFESYAKGRWIGRTVYDVFCTEFQSEKPEYYEKAIKLGKVTVDGQIAEKDTFITANTLVCHTIHRHEPPVTDKPLNIIYEDHKMVVINKPSSITVHPCGRYRHNSIVFILAKEYGIRNLHTIHRLDRLTSGILMFSKNLSKAQEIEQQIRKRELTKTYLARVKGEFPEGDIECNEPIIIVSHKLGVCHVSPSGKPCTTTFTRILYDGVTSLVKCMPKTGRMHQIRVHLQWLGFPVLNDPLYNHPAWGSERGRKGQGVGSMEQVLADIVKSRFQSDVGEEEEQSKTETIELGMEDHNVERGISENRKEITSEEGETGVRTEDDRGIRDKLKRSISDDNLVEQPNKKSKLEDSFLDSDTHTPDPTPTLDPDSHTHHPDPTPNLDPDSHTHHPDSHTHHPDPIPNPLFDPDCTECNIHRPDPTPNDFIMYLHALKYSGHDWEYSTEYPEWAHKDWKYNDIT